MSALAFTGVRIFDGAAFVEGVTVVVEGARIAAVTAGATRLDGMPSIDGAGRTLLPGFIDCHVHIGLHDPRAVLSGGVTAVRDLGWPLERILPIAGALASPGARGPRVSYAGPIVTAPGGYPMRAAWAPAGTGLPVRTEEEASLAVRALLARGASVVKVAQEPRAGRTMPMPVLRAIVAEAHAAGLRVASHCGALSQLDVAIEAGVDELAHGLWSSERIPDATLDALVGAGVVVLPTLHVEPHPTRIENLRRFLDRGGRAIYGTDMGNPPSPPGIDPEELTLMIAAGMSLAESLASATRHAADQLGCAVGARSAKAHGQTSCWSKATRASPSRSSPSRCSCYATAPWARTAPSRASVDPGRRQARRSRCRSLRAC